MRVFELENKVFHKKFDRIVHSCQQHSNIVKSESALIFEKKILLTTVNNVGCKCSSTLQHVVHSYGFCWTSNLVFNIILLGKMFLKLQFPSSSLRQNWRNMGESSIYIEFTRPQINVQCSLHYTAARVEDQTTIKCGS